MKRETGVTTYEYEAEEKEDQGQGGVSSLPIGEQIGFLSHPFGTAGRW